MVALALKPGVFSIWRMGNISSPPLESTYLFDAAVNRAAQEIEK
jgi:hypothetical protein